MAKQKNGKTASIRKGNVYSGKTQDKKIQFPYLRAANIAQDFGKDNITS